jgi:hypothetical protein
MKVAIGAAAALAVVALVLLVLLTSPRVTEWLL